MISSFLSKVLGRLVPSIASEATPSKSSQSTESHKKDLTESKRKLEGYTFTSLAVGALCILLFAAHVPDSPQEPNFYARAGASFALALGAVVLGALLGFLFGIPRTLQHDQAPQASSILPEQEQIGYQINTNLEQISDWLTKIIVGVGLIELGSIGSWLTEFSKVIGDGFGEDVFGQAFVLGVLVYFTSAGFLFGYLWTRFRFGPAIKEADKLLVEQRIEIEAGVRADHQAIQLVARQLSPAHSGDAGVSPQDLNNAVARATRLAKVKIFGAAATARQDEELREQSIPVFQALTEADKLKKFHRNYGELGYALKDQSMPDWAAADQAFTKAIEIRDRVEDSGYHAYEYDRAICRINLKRPKADIIPDLETAAKENWLRNVGLQDKTLIDWCKKNKISMATLGFM